MRYVLAEDQSEITCRYIPGQDRVLFCDGHAIGVRSDYNGVLLLDTILQKPVSNPKDNVKLELLLSEVCCIALHNRMNCTFLHFTGHNPQTEFVFGKSPWNRSCYK